MGDQSTDKTNNKRSVFFKALPFLFFSCAFVFYESVLRAFATDNVFWGIPLVRILIFACAFGVLVAFLLSLLPRLASRIVGGIIAVASFVIYGIEYCCMDFYGMYFGLFYTADMTGKVVGGFSDTIREVVSTRIPQILLLLVPVIVYFVLWKFLFIEKLTSRAGLVLVPVLSVCALVTTVFLCRFGSDHDLYTYDFEPNTGIQRFGLTNSLGTELCYKVFGKPEVPARVVSAGEPLFTTFTEATTVETTVTETVATTEGEEAAPTPTPSPTPYPYNITDIDFESLYNDCNDNRIKDMHLYFGNLAPTQQNEYTGIFKDKNLILITAEGFCPYAIDKDYTPTLYRLANESFVFTNFYEPNWHLSTTGGEYSVMTGQIPQWIGSSNSFYASSKVSMPLALGHIFGDMGYVTPAWHNGAYTFYDRDKTHPNLGYDFSAIDHGLDLPTRTWPASDCEMFEATCDSYINDYYKTGQKFHAYYMTVSGHCNYSWGANAMSKRHKESAIEAFPDSSPAVQAYKACNKDLDLGLEYLIKQLEEKGIAEDTVIVMAADHYPYGIAKGTDYYKELSGIDDTEQDISRYRNTLVIWCGAMTDSIVVDTPSMTCDIVPTILNLFGIPYDSRLYAGRDIFATNYVANECSSGMPLAILPVNAGNSWVTAAGFYDCRHKEFTPAPGVTVSDDYVDQVNAYVKDKWRYSGMMIQYDYFSKLFGKEEQ